MHALTVDQPTFTAQISRPISERILDGQRNSLLQVNTPTSRWSLAGHLQLLDHPARYSSVTGSIHSTGLPFSDFWMAMSHCRGRRTHHANACDWVGTR